MTISGDGLSIKGIGECLKTRFLAVPSNQRSYAWKQEEVEDYWSDVVDAMESGHEDYFIGSIVLSYDNASHSVPEVVDGQQRLATTMIIYGAVRDWLQANGHNEHADVYEKYLADQDEETLERQPKLTLNTDDDTFFREHVVERTSDGKRKNPIRQAKNKRFRESHKRIAAAAETIRRLVAERAQGRPEDSVAKLKRLLTYLGRKVRFISVEVPDNEHAYTIFETLNDRGRDLTKADLLKNHIFRTARNKQTLVEAKWNEMVGSIETVGKEDLTVDYIRYYWISERGHVREKELYKRIKRSVLEPSQAVSLSSDLAENAILYSAILNSDHDRWLAFGEQTKTILSNLIMLGIDRLHPITLAVVRSFNDNEIKKALQFLVCASVRIMIAGPPAGTFEQRVAAKAPLIGKQGLKTTRELIDCLTEGDVVPGDSAFKSEFATASTSKERLARYYLRALERQANNFMPACMVSYDDMKGTLEHVLPQSPSAAWNITEDEARALRRRIGNLALLPGNKNAQLGNSDFETIKAPAYAESPITLTREIGEGKFGETASWGREEIEKRQIRLAELAVQAWPLTV